MISKNHELAWKSKKHTSWVDDFPSKPKNGQKNVETGFRLLTFLVDSQHFSETENNVN